MGRRAIGISRSLIWSKTLMELIFNPSGEFRWSPEIPISQIHSPHLHVGAPGIFSDRLRSVQMLKSEWSAEINEKLPHLFNPLVKLQTWFLSLRWKTCLRQNCSLGSWPCSEGPAIGQSTLMIYYITLHYNMGRRAIGISGSLIWSKTLMKLIFNPCGEFRWSPEGQVSQIHSPHLHVVPLGSFQII